MPTHLDAYACRFECGTPIVCDRDAMTAHEHHCEHNPANRACLTCKHDSREPPIDSPDPLCSVQGLVLHTCVLGHRDLFISCIVHCKHYRQKREEL